MILELHSAYLAPGAKRNFTDKIFYGRLFIPWTSLSGTDRPEGCEKGRNKGKSSLQSFQVELERVAEEELVAVDIGHVCWAFPQYNVVEEVLLDQAEYWAVGEEEIPEDSSLSRCQTGDREVEPLTEQTSHKTVIPPGSGQAVEKILKYAKLAPGHRQDLLSVTGSNFSKGKPNPGRGNPNPSKAEIRPSSPRQSFPRRTPLRSNAALSCCPGTHT